MKPAWVVMPALLQGEHLLNLTMQAIRDCLDQKFMDPELLTRVLVVSNDSDQAGRKALEQLQEESERVLVWHHTPALPTLDATWNRALQACWESGATEALVVNNDIRLRPDTYRILHAAMKEQSGLFVSAVGVREEQFHPTEPTTDALLDGLTDDRGFGGPDYSCFLISEECHRRFPFDPTFTYFGDNDHHWRIKLAGEGGRIFGVNVPYLHYGSQTINRTPEAAVRYRKVFEKHREQYVKKWGGEPGHELFRRPYDPESVDSPSEEGGEL